MVEFEISLFVGRPPHQSTSGLIFEKNKKKSKSKKVKKKILVQTNS